MRKIKVLLTCLGGRFSFDTLYALRQSKQPKIEIVGADVNSDVTIKYFVDSFYTVPHGLDYNYAREILRICKKEKVEIVIPGADEEVIALSGEKEKFTNSGIVCAVDDYSTLELVTDKARLFDFLSKNNICMPRYKIVNTAKEVVSAADYLGYPKRKFILKPTRSRGARNVWLIGKDNKSVTLKAFLEHIKRDRTKKLNYLAVEFLPGFAYDVDVIAKEGKPFCIVPRRRLWRNPFSASSEGCVIEKNRHLTDLVAEITKLLNLNYAYDFDCGSFGNSRPAIYEINPRFSAAVAASLAGGVNLPVMLVRLLKGMKLPKCSIMFNVSMFPISKMMFSKAGKLLYGNKNKK